MLIFRVNQVKFIILILYLRMPLLKPKALKIYLICLLRNSEILIFLERFSMVKLTFLVEYF